MKKEEKKENKIKINSGRRAVPQNFFIDKKYGKEIGAGKEDGMILISEAARGSEYKKGYLVIQARSGNLKAKKTEGKWYTTKEWLDEFTEERKKEKENFKKGLSEKLGTLKTPRSFKYYKIKFLKFAEQAIVVLVVLLLVNISQVGIGKAEGWQNKTLEKIMAAYNNRVETLARGAEQLSKGTGEKIRMAEIGEKKMKEIRLKIEKEKKEKIYEEKYGIKIEGEDEGKNNLMQIKEGIVAGEESSVNSEQGTAINGRKGIVLAEVTEGNINIGDVEVNAYVLGKDNQEITNGNYEVRFGLYALDRIEADPYPSDADQAERVWEETQTVEIQNGLLSTFLGKINEIPASVNFGSQTYYLGIRIAQDPELIPRKRIAAVPLSRIALNALTANSISGYTVGNASGNIPLSNGTVNINLNADFIDGMDSGDFATTTDISNISGYSAWKLQTSSTDAGQKIKSGKGAIFTGSNGITTARSLNILTVSPTYGSTANTIAQGNTPLIVSTTGNLSGGGAGSAGGGINLTLDTVASPTFSGLTLNGTLTMGANAIDATNYDISAAGIITGATWNGTDIDISDYTNLAVAGTLLNLSGDTLSVDEGTLTNNRLCTYVAGTGLVCDTAPGGVGTSYWDQTGINIYNNNSGNVGVGTTVFGSKLTVSGGVGIGTTSPSSVYFSTAAPDGGMIIEGNVGIGTTNPLNKLHVEGTGGGSAGIYMNDAAPSSTATTIYNSGGNLYWGTTNLTGGGALPGGTEGQMLYNNAGAWTAFDGMYWDDSTSRLGIGTTSPSAKLSIAAGHIKLDNNYGLLWGGGSTGIYGNQTLSTFEIDTNATARLKIDSNGYVGINTTAPTDKLDVAGGVKIGATYAGMGTTAPTNGLLVEGNVGIGTTNPGAKLSVQGTVNVGINDTGYDVNFYGADSGSRMFWDESKMAFRVGGVTGAQWDDANVGNYSLASGLNTTASGSGSFASGHRSGNNGSIVATNIGSVALGFANSGADGNANITSSGYGSFALGYANPLMSSATITASGNGSIAMGYATSTNTLQATGIASVAMGENVQAVQSNTMAFGKTIVNNTANSFMVGFSATPALTVLSSNVGIGTTNPGYKLEVNGSAQVDSFRLGSIDILDDGGSIARVYGSLRVNSNAYVNGNLGIGASAPTDLLDVGGGVKIGSSYAGMGTTAPANGLLVQGNVGIGTTNPIAALTVNGDIFPDSDDDHDLGDNTHRWQDLFLGPATLHIGTDTTDEYTLSYDTDNDRLGFNVNGSGNPEIVMNSSGYLGIGTTNPGFALDVNGTINGTALYVNGSPYIGSQWTTSGLNIYYNTGNVGIGTTNPLAYLSVAAATGSKASLNVAPSSGVDPTSPNIGDLWFNGTNLFFRKDISTSLDLLASVSNPWISSGSDIYFGSSSTGNVGIGTTTPGAVLEISGGTREITGLKISNLDLANYAIDLSAAGLGGATDYYIYVDGGTTYWRADGAFATPGAVTATSLIDYDNGSYYLDPSSATTSLLAAGKVGIGTISPDNLLSLNMLNGDPILDFRIADSTEFSLGVDDSDSNKFKIEYGSALGNAFPALVINSSSQVGMGTDSPDNLLSLNAAAGSNPIIDFQSAGVTRFSLGVDDFDSDKFKIETGATLGGGTPAFVINSSGQIGIGTSAPATLLTVNGGHITFGPLNATTAAELRFLEGSDNGTDYIGLKAPAVVDASLVFTLPSADGTSGQILQTNGSQVLSWSDNAATGMSNPMTTTGDIIYSSSGSTPARRAIGTAGQCLVVTAGVPAWGSCAAGASVAGADTQIQYNNAGAFGANADFTWNNTNKTLSAGALSFTGARISLALRNSSAGTGNSNELQIGNDTAANALSLTMNSSTFTGAANYAYIYNKNNGPILIGTNNLERIRIEAGGNVGIGVTTALSAKFQVLDNAVTTGNGILATTTSLTAGNLMLLQSTSTAAASNTQTVLKIDTSGANGTATQTTYGIYATNTHTGTTATNIGGYFSATSVSAGSVSYSLQTGAMTGETSYGLSIGAMSGTVTNIGVNIGAITSAATSGIGINMGNIGVGGTGAYIVTGTNSSTGGIAYQLNLGPITGNNATFHTGVAIGAISGTTPLAYGLTTSTITGGSTSNIAIQTGAVSGTATNNYGMNIGTVTGGTTANYGLNISAVTSTGATNSYGTYIATMVGTGSSKYGYYLGGITSTVASTNNIGVYVGAISGSVVTTTTNTGIQVASIAGGATNNYGINVGTVTGGTTSNQALITGAVSGTATNNYGMNIGTVTGGTSGNYGLNVGAVTGIPFATNAGINVAAVAGPAGSTVYGINVAAPTATGTYSYGMRINGPTGAATSNYGLNIVVPTTATHNSALVIGTPPTTAGTWALYSAAANNSYFAGNVGIATATPGSALDVKGTLRLSGSASGYVGLVAAAAAGSTTYTLPSSDGTNGQILQTSGGGVLSWATNAATGMSNPMTTTGDMIYALAGGSPGSLAIGTAGQCLVVSGGVPIWGSCAAGASVAGANTQVQFNNSGAFGASANFTWDNTNYTLSSLGAIAGSKVSLALRNTDTGTTTTNELRIGNNTAADTFTLSVNSSANTAGANYAYIMNRQNAPLIIGTNNTERIRILSNGNVGIGTTNPQAKLHINGKTQIEAVAATASGSGAIIDFKRTLDGWNPAKIEQLYATTGAGYGGILTFSTNGQELGTLTERMRIDQLGNVGIGTVAPTAKLHLVDNAVTTGNSLYVSATSLTTGTLAYLISNTTAARANQTVLNVTNTGTNDAGSITTYGLQVSNTHSGTLATNIAGIFTATGGSTNYGVRVAAMTGPTNYGLDIGALSGNTTNYGVNIGNISAGGTTDYAIQIGTIAGGGTGAAMVTGAVSTTGANAYQLSLGTITGNNATAHVGINLGNISGITANAYGLNIGTITGATGSNYGVNINAITTTGATNSYGVYIGAPTGSGTNKYAIYSAGITSNNLSTNAGIYIGAISGSTGASTNTGIQIASIAGTSANAYGLNIGTITGATGVNYGVNIGAITSTGATNSYGMYQAAMVGTGSSKYAFYSAGLTSTTVSVNNVGIYMGAISGSTAGTTNTGMQIGNISGVALNNYGINLGTLTGGTTANYQINLGAVTAVAAATNYGINIAGTSGAAVSSNNYGVKIASLTSSGTGTANYGMNIVQPAGATHDAALEIGTPATIAGDWAIFSSGTANSYFAGNIGIGTSAPASPLHIKSSTAAGIQIDPFGTSTGNMGEMRFLELVANGTNYVGFKAPDSISANRVWILPNADGTSGQVLQTNGSQVLSWTANSASGMANPMTTTGDIIYGSTTATPANPARLGIGTAGQCLVVSGGLPSWGTCTGSSVAAGSDTYIQYNDAGNFGANADFTWNNTNKTLSSLGTVAGAKISLALRNSSDGSSATNELRIGNDTAADTFALYVNSSANTSGANNAYIMNRQNGSLIIGTGNLERIRILSNGNVGIGSTNPVALLDVFGTGAFGLGTEAAPGIAFRTNLNTGMWSSGTNTINFSTNALERIRILSNGSVGIGTTSPSTLFDVGGTVWLRGAPLGQAGVYVKNDGNVGIGSTNPVATLDVFGVGAFGLGTESAPGIAFRTNLNTGIWSSGTNTLNFSTNGTERIRILSNGNVGIGTLAPVGKLVVMGTGITTGISFRTTNADNVDTFTIMDNGNVGIGTSTPLALLQIGAAPNPGLFVTSAGNVSIGTTNSDNKLQIVATSVPTADMVKISNTGYGVVTGGISALQVNYVGGEAAVEASSIRSDITPGATSGSTWNAIRLVGTAAAPGVSMNALKVDNLTGSDGTETAINIGTGWDFGVYSATTGISYFAGNVGIGTTNPLTQFHIYSGSSGANPSMLLAGNSSGDTDFWLARVNDGGSDDDDTFQIGDGTIPGTNPYLTINTQGNIGIGTTNPATLLHLKGGHLTLGSYDDSTPAEIRWREAATNGTEYLAFKAPDSVGASVTWTLPSSDGTIGQILQTSGGGVLSWTANSASGMANPMTTTGDIIYGSDTAVPSNPARLGIGTAGQCLVVTDGIPAWGSCAAGATVAGSNTQIQFNNAGAFGAAAEFTWDNTAAAKTLGVGGTIAGAKISIATRNSSNGSSATNEIRIGNDTAADTFTLYVNSSANSAGAHNAYIYNRQNAPLVFGTNNTERMRILAGGNVGIGTTNPGALLDVINNSLTTTKIANLSSLGTGLTTGSLLYVSSATTGAVATNGIVSLNATGNYTSTANIGLLNVAANATTAGTIANVTGNALTTGQALRVTSTSTGLTSGSLLYATSATTSAVATSGIVSLNATGNYSSTSNVGLLSVMANATTAGTIQNIQGNALTTGQALYISGTANLTTGSLLYATSATAGALATNGIVSINATGNYTSTSSLIGALSVQANATAAGTVANITGNVLTTGQALRIASTGTGLTTGSLLYVSAGTTGAVATNGIVSLNATGAYTSTSDVGLLNVIANATLTGTITNMAGNALTSGKILNLSSSSTAFTGIMANLTLSGNNAANTGTLLKITSSGASNTGVPLMVTNLGAGLSFRVNDETGDADISPFVIDATGDVGIGNSTPTDKLDVAGGVKIGATYAGMGTTAPTNGLLVQGNVGIGTTTPSTRLVVQGTNSEASLGSEMITNLVDRDFSGTPNWTGVGWSLSGGTWSHVAGANATTLDNAYVAPDPVVDSTYKITFTVVTTTAGTLTPSFGGADCSAVGQATGTLTAYTCVVTATNTNALNFTPNAAWEGTLDNISVMLITPSNALATLNNSNGAVGLEIRSGGASLYNSFIGYRAGRSNTTGEQNSALGYGALVSNTTGSNNSAVGINALFSNTTGSYNSALGPYALYANTTGSNNSAVGYFALYANTTGSFNSALGYGALVSNTTGSYNSAVGRNALSSNTTGQYNSAVGYQALDFNTTGSNNSAVGINALYFNDTGSYNTALGREAGYMNSTGSYNVFLGYGAGYYENGSNKLYIANSDTTSLMYGDFSTGAVGIGGTAASTNPYIYVKSDGMVGIGTTAPSTILTLQGANSVATLGSEMITNTVDRDFSGAPNWTGVGWSLSGGTWSHTAGANATTLDNGFLTGPPVVGSTYKITFTVVTTTAGSLTPWFGGNTCSAVGQSTGTLTAYTCVVTAGSTDALTFTPNVAWEGTLDNISVMLITPSNALATLNNSNGTAGLEIRSGGASLYNTAVGLSALRSNTTGSNNSAVGYKALFSNYTGYDNSAVGSYALYSNTTGYQNSAVGDGALSFNTTGYSNSALGYYTLSSNTTGSENSALGDSALYFNTTGYSNSALGYGALLFNTTGSYNTALGQEAGYNNSTGSSNVFLGYKAGYNETGSNKLWIANSNTTSLIYGDFSTGAVGLGGTAASTNPYIYVKSDGMVGIGTSNPGMPLDVVGDMRTNGCVYYNGGTLGACASDQRLKKNIDPLAFDNALEKVMGLQPKTFSYKNDPARLYSGLIAQDVQQVAPELVTTGSNGYLQVKYGDVQWLTIEAIQQQQGQIGQSLALGEANSRALGEAVDNLDLKITENKSDVSGLQTAVNEKLNIVSNSLASLDSRTATNETEIANLKTQLATAETHLQESELNLATFQTATTDTLTAMLQTENMLTERILSHEDRIKALEDKIATLTVQGGGTLPDNVITQDKDGNVTLAGIFKSKEVQTEGVVAGSYTAVNEDKDSATVGEIIIYPKIQDENKDGIDDITGKPIPPDADNDGINDATGKPIIESDGKTVKVSTKAIDKNSRVLATPIGSTPINWIISSVDENVGFTISLDKETTQEIKFNWWIVEEK